MQSSLDDYIVRVFPVDIDECEVGGYCSQLCDNEVGSFQCSCVDGFTSGENGTCSALG